MLAYTKKRIEKWNRTHAGRPGLHGLAAYYHRLLQNHFRFFVPEGQRVLELGCANGDLLAALEPAFGLGIDFSIEAIRVAKRNHPKLHLVVADAHALPIAAKFDAVVLSDLMNDLWDAQLLFQRLAKIIHKRTRVIINSHSRIWQLPLSVAEGLGAKNRTLPQNWFTVEDIENLLKLTDYELIRHTREILLPANIPLVSWFFNKFLVKFWPFDAFALTNFLIARPVKAATDTKSPSVSVIVAARNEAGNIAGVFERTPKLGSQMEIIFVEGHSKDNTYETIEKEIAAHPNQQASLLKQTGVGKADAVWAGFAAARNDILMILDADLSVPPEDLARFYEALVSNKAEFVNGARLVYPMENRAMRPANLIGNKVFSLIFSWLLGQPTKDTLCGTKVMWRGDFLLLQNHWPLFNKLDPFGDFDLLFGASKLSLKILDLPIRYRERTYGETNISRWRHGWMLLRITTAAARVLKFRV